MEHRRCLCATGEQGPLGGGDVQRGRRARFALLCVKRWPNVGKSGLHVMTHGSADLLQRPAASACPRL